MKFKLKQEKLQMLLEKLLVKDMFVDSVISVKEKKLFSIQKEEHGRAVRFVKFNTSFFEEIDDATESMEIDTLKIFNVIKNVSSETDLTVETKGSKLSISGKNVDINFSYKTPEGEVFDSLPFEMDKGIPVVGDGKVRLDTELDITLVDLKEITAYAGALKTEFYKFMIKDKRITVRVGDLHDFSDYVIFEPESKVLNGDELDATYTYGIIQVAETFDNEVKIKIRTASPIWIYEGTKEYTLGVLIPPYVEADE